MKLDGPHIQNGVSGTESALRQQHCPEDVPDSSYDLSIEQL